MKFVLVNTFMSFGNGREHLYAHKKMLATPSHGTWLLCPLTLIEIFIILVWTCQAFRSFGWTVQCLLSMAIILVPLDELCLVHTFMSFGKVTSNSPNKPIFVLLMRTIWSFSLSYSFFLECTYIHTYIFHLDNIIRWYAQRQRIKWLDENWWHSQEYLTTMCKSKW